MYGKSKNSRGVILCASKWLQFKHYKREQGKIKKAFKGGLNA